MNTDEELDIVSFGHPVLMSSAPLWAINLRDDDHGVTYRRKGLNAP
ncbi:hypothetical protein [Saccharothrix xinjiangensis]|uniref:Uncharacterized protein n=1 Tax=Saccharothrix xinjiangensis TaxID=204798 RepID=A0ABV9XY91_9PSEU